MDAYLPHLIEFRKRLIRSIFVLIGVFLLLFIFDHHLYQGLAKPLLNALPYQGQMIAIDITTPFTIPMKLAFISALILTAPYWLYELWSFIAPGLYLTEKKAILPLIITSTLLFYSGIVFAYFILCPMALYFFTHSAPKNVFIMTDIAAYTDFMLTLLFAGGLAFQVPVVTSALLKSGIMSREQMAHARPYVIVGAFVLGMFLTPPDVVSQIVVALPMWGLFELTFLLHRSIH